jgi:hypothetical protein
MTPKQKETHVNGLNKILENHGAATNNYGIYHLKEYSFDTRKNNLKICHKGVKIGSKLLTDISPEMLEKWLKVHGL